MKLEDFISKENPWEYNFEFECGDAKFTSLETLGRYFIFKALPKGDYGVYDKANQFINSLLVYSNIYDPDGSGYAYYPLTHNIYSALWNWQKGEDTFGKINNSGFEKINGSELCLFGGDTMNSVQYVLNDLYAIFEKEVNSKLKLTKRGRKKISLSYMLQCMQDDPGFCEVFLSETKIKNVIEQYINAYHTLGNFVLVPAGFNAFRGGDKVIRDYLDLSLKHLANKGYFKKDTTTAFKNKKEYFDWYINYFFLWDYVKPNKKRGYMFRQISPRDKNDNKQYKRFFTKTVRLIKRRGKFMTAMLMIQTQNPALYKDEIQTFLTNEEFRAKSISDAARQILENSELGKKIPENAKSLLDELKKG